jgi:tetrahydromethanopterin S-methyltransferase subunit G
MRRELFLCLSLPVVIISMWTIRSSGEERQSAARGSERVQTTNPKASTTPCLVNQNSMECALARLDGVDARLEQINSRLDQLQVSLTTLESRSAGVHAPAAPITPLPIPKQHKADDAFNYLQDRIDALAVKVNQLVDQMNRR